MSTDKELDDACSRMKSVAEWLSDIQEACKDNDVVADVVTRLFPSWIEPVGKIVAGEIPILKIAVKVFEALTKDSDPNSLGILAATLAYQKSVSQALQSLGKKIVITSRPDIIKLLDETTKKEYNFETFSFDRPEEHAFVVDCDTALQSFIKNLRIGNKEAVEFQNKVYERFFTNLLNILSHDSTAEKFAPFRKRMTLRTDFARANFIILEHQDYLKWLYDGRNVRGESYTLRDIFIEPTCEVLTWKELNARASRESEAGDQMHNSEEDGGDARELTPTLLNYIFAESCNQPLVVQGYPGSGKSACTIRLCYELMNEGFFPIRISLKNIDTRKGVLLEDALAKEIRLRDGENDTKVAVVSREKFLGLFERRVKRRQTTICPYILILDGWDEVKVNVDSYRDQMEEMLQSVRQLFFNEGGGRVRVILAGRSNDAVINSKFLQPDTPIFKLKDFTTEQVNCYIDKIAAALTEKTSRGDRTWNVPPKDRILEIVRYFRKIIKKSELIKKIQKADSSMDRYRSGEPNYEILRVPLLAQLAFRLLTELPRVEDAELLLKNPTHLYRCLVDLTIEKAVKPADVGGTSLMSGQDLRYLLQQTAAVITIIGKESITKKELEAGLDGGRGGFGARIGQCLDSNRVTSLLTSFFFRGGIADKDIACEFSHRSFREYFFAEQITEKLKAAARIRNIHSTKSEYWMDFTESSTQYQLSRALCELLAPRWMTPEVAYHLDQLIEWEIKRAEYKDPYPIVGNPTAGISINGWKQIRRLMAELWEWWGECAHLRSQPFEDNKNIEFNDPYAISLAERLLSIFGRSDDGTLKPERLLTIDSHLGDSFFRITESVHYHLIPADSRAALASSKIYNHSDAILFEQEYQTKITNGEHTIIRFRPTGDDCKKFKMYVSRINASQMRPWGEFPGRALLRGLDFTATDLERLNLRNSIIEFSDCYSTVFDGAFCNNIQIYHSNLEFASFTEASLYRAAIIESCLIDVSFEQTDLRDSKVERSIIQITPRSPRAEFLAFYNVAYFTEWKQIFVSIDAARLNGAKFIDNVISSDLAAKLVSVGIENTLAGKIEGVGSNKSQPD